MNKLAPTQSAPDAGVVRIEFLAAKLAAIQNLDFPCLSQEFSERPELREMLLFLQWVSMQPGGLAKFVAELLETFPERIGTPTMITARGRKYSAEDKLRIWYELPEKNRPQEFQHSAPDLSAEILLTGWKEDAADYEAEELRALQKLLGPVNTN